jgi:hypothetical protein
MSNATDAATPELTAEHRLELQRLQAQNTTAKLEIAKLDAESRNIAQETNKLLQGQATRDAVLESGIKFYPTADDVALHIAEKHDLRFDEGKLTGVLDGKRISLAKLLQHIAVENDFLVSDRRSLRGKSESAEPIRARSEFTKEEKIALLGTPGGLDKWEKMAPFATRNVPIDALTRSEFSRLPIETKTRIVGEKGARFETWFAALPKEPRKF